MDEVIFEKSANGVALVKLNRPGAYNSLNMQTRKLLAEIFIKISVDNEVKCVVITGNSNVFAAGADIKEMVDARPIEMLLRNMELLWKPIAECPKPLIAAVNGYALGGGCELAMHADVIIAGEKSFFGQPEIKVGIMPGAGGTQRLTRAIGKYKAMMMLLTGDMINGKEAYETGLVSKLVADDEVLGSAIEIASKIAKMPSIAIRQIKEVVLSGQDVNLTTALALERKSLQLLFDSNDQKEGMRSFIEKRKPVFGGN